MGHARDVIDISLPAFEQTDINTAKTVGECAGNASLEANFPPAPPPFLISELKMTRHRPSNFSETRYASNFIVTDYDILIMMYKCKK